MSIYTKNGDGGYSSILGGERLRKSDQLFEVLGDIDELNACLGVVKVPKIKTINKNLEKIQNVLFNVGAILADPKKTEIDLTWVDEKVSVMEELIDDLDSQLPRLNEFILPGGTNSSGRLHIARAVCRRVERHLILYIALSKKPHYNKLIVYFNRLADLLFIMARYVNFKNGVKDISWIK